MVASRLGANAYAIGLNVPLALLYSVTSRAGISIKIGLLLVPALVFLLILELISDQNDKIIRACIASVILGSIVFWSVILLVYGNVSESQVLVYRISDAALVGGIVLVMAGVFVSYIYKRCNVGDG